MLSRIIFAGLVLPSLAFAQAATPDPDWKKDNFAGRVPQEILQSRNGRIELARIFGTRRFSHADTVTSVAFSPDGKSALSASLDGSVILWDVASGKDLDSIVVDGSPTSLALQGSLLAVGNRNTSVTLYKLK